MERDERRRGGGGTYRWWIMDAIIGVYSSVVTTDNGQGYLQEYAGRKNNFLQV